jgi:hypothetical protein
MNKKAACVLCCLLITLAAIPACADEPDELFTVFLARLVRRHDELKNLIMPNLEILNASEIPDEALYLLTFRTPAAVQTFTAALNEENVTYGIFPQNELQVVLFFQDMAMFLLWDAMGLLE